MSMLDWSEALVLRQPRMDTTHREFVELLAALEAAVAEPPQAVDAALRRLVEHTDAHFAQEERWMEALGFAAENCHRFQHAHVLQVMREVERLHAADGDLRLVRQLVDELARWFPAHAQAMDGALAQVMEERGFDPETGHAAAPAPAEPITSCGGAGCR